MKKKIKKFLFIFSPDHGILSTKKVVPKKKNFPANRNYFSTFFSVHTSELGFRWIIWSLKKKCWGEVIFFWIFWFQIWPKSWDLDPWEGFIWPLKSKKRRNIFAACHEDQYKRRQKQHRTTLIFFNNKKIEIVNICENSHICYFCNIWWRLWKLVKIVKIGENCENWWKL